MEILKNNKVVSASLVLIICLSLLTVVKIGTEIKSLRFIGGGVAPSNTITFDGIGEINAVPDIARINLSVREEEKTVKEAQDKVSIKISKALKLIKDSGVSEKDIKTEIYNSYPKYDFKYDDNNTCGANTCPPRPARQVLIGYEVSQNITVTVRKIDETGTILDKLASVEVSDISGPSFDIDKKDELKAKARKIAISEAKNKAQLLAKDLGVDLVRIVNFSEGGNYPVFSRADLKVASFEGAAAPAPELPVGENKITSNVSITYEIR